MSACLAPAPSLLPAPESRLTTLPASSSDSRTGPLRNGNPRGDPNAAPRCGARTRAGCACRAPAMANGRCRMHGGKCTGPRTSEGMARMIAAKTTHGRFAAASAPRRALHRHVHAVVARHRLLCTATLLLPHLPPAFAAQLAHPGPELTAPPHPWPLTLAEPMPSQPAEATAIALKVRAAERAAALGEREVRAPWLAAIAFARTVKRGALMARRVAREARRHSPGGETRKTSNDPMQRELARRGVCREIALRAAGLRRAPVASATPGALIC
jgi:hypothetical protein